MTGRLLITGGEGRLARVAAPLFAAADWEVTAPAHHELDVTDRDEVRDAIGALRPTAVLNLAAWTSMHACEKDPEGARQVNTLGVRHVAEACRTAGAHLCHLSSDYVFDGTKTDGPYAETDPTAPISVYGVTKRAGELEVGDDATLVRTAWMSGPFGPNVVHAVLDQAADPDRALAFVDDQHGSPTSAEDLVGILLLLIDARLPGLFHVTNQGSASWFDIARVVLDAAGHDPGRVRPVSCVDIEPSLATLRPRFSVLDNAALRAASIPLLPSWEPSFRRLVDQVAAARPA